MTEGFDQSYADEQIRRRSSPLRRMVKSRYLDNLTRRLQGPTIDLGCGAGQLLERLPPGSVGLELNDALISYLRTQNLDVLKYDALQDDFGLSPLFAAGRGPYRHLVCAHVIEHFDDAAHAVRQLLRTGERLGLESLLFVVPGKKGFSRDATHRTFVTEAFIREQRLADQPPYHLASVEYFPGNWRKLGDWFAYHECHLTWRR
jgi:2-polyprenyl-3-methyl-5-hydroxy-6-metoxy-1,4-benzoquinol methylase